MGDWAGEGELRGVHHRVRRYRWLLFALGGAIVLLMLASRGAVWAGPMQSPLRQTIPTRTPTPGSHPTNTPPPTNTPRPTVTATATRPPGVEQSTLQQGLNGYEGTSDTFLDFRDPSGNYGTANQLDAHSDGTQVALLRFDLSEVPTDITVLRADLQLFAVAWTASRSATASVFRVLRHWEENEATWVDATTPEEWFFPGCGGLGTDRAVVPEGTETLSGIDYRYSFEVTASVAAWLADQEANHGLLLVASGGADVGYSFASSSHSVVGYHPALVITYVEGQVTPTVTPTGGATLTPSPTTTPFLEVFQHGVSPVGYEGVSDTYIDAWDPTMNYGTLWPLWLRSGDVKAALIRFELSLLPPGAQVERAELGVYWDFRSNTANMPVSAHRVLRPWVDTEATWQRARLGDDWGTAGCNSTVIDRQSVSDDTQELGSKGAGDRWYYFDVTDMARYWLEHPDENHGLILKTGGTSSVEYRLESSDSWNRDCRPKLSVYYRVATPTPQVTATPTLAPTMVPGGIAGVVWDDQNGDRLMGEEEPPMPGVELVLKSGNGVPLAQCLTDFQGHYAFTDLDPVLYWIQAVCPSGYEPTTPDEVWALPGPGVILPIDFGVRRVVGHDVVLLPMVLK